jgi:acyl transferase domain-containing protein
MNNKNDARTGFEVAVIGMAGRFPGAGSIDEFWENLEKGVESVIFFSDRELEESGVSSSTYNSPGYVRARGYLEGVEEFDASFFGLRPMEAEMMDPQMRVFYQTAWHALEHAGYVPGKYNGSIGMYAGASSGFFWEALTTFSGDGGAAAGLASVQYVDKNYLATGLSYKLNLKGPAFTLHTACSTSLLAIHLACQALLSGECHMALAGGVSVTLPPKNGYMYREGLIQSPDGYCRAFDREASGTVFGSGVGVVVLKSLEDALAGRDTIHAVIKGSAVNNDGSRKVGYTAPSTQGQAQVIRAAYRAAEVNPETVNYIEAHGTGTALGDPIEIEALKQAFNSQKKQFCRIGAVKPNIGHLDAAAGAAGLIKTVLALKHRRIPPSLHVKTPNPRIGFEDTPFLINTALTPWEPVDDHTPLRAGVSSFGVGGTNVHVVLEEVPQQQDISVQPGAGQREYHLLPLSAKHPSALDSMTAELAEHLQSHPQLSMPDAAYTLQVGRESFPYRRMLVCRDREEAVRTLSESQPGQLHTFHALETDPPVVFMFPGQGSQYENMGHDLYRREPLFRREMERCFDILEPLLDFDLRSLLFPGKSPLERGRGAPPISPGIEAGDGVCRPGDAPEPTCVDTQAAQPLLFIFEYALARLLMSWGILPDTMIGHSIGEYTAACLSGALSLEEALSIVAVRGRLMQQMETGSMLGVKITEEQLLPFMQPHPEVELAAVNGPSLCVVSGPHTAVRRFADEMEDRGYRCRTLHTSHAFHSRSMEPMLDQFQQQVEIILKDGSDREAPEIQLNIPFISNLTGQPITPDQVRDPVYWAAHLRRTVRFGDGLKELFKEPDTLFVEVGPGRALSTFVRQHDGKEPSHKALNLVRHPHEEVSDGRYLLEKLGLLWIYGKEISWRGFYDYDSNPGLPHRIPMPVYPFQTRRYWKVMERYIKDPGLSAGSVGVDRPRGVSRWFYRPYWRRLELPPPAAVDNGDGSPALHRWFIFLDDLGWGEKLALLLEDRGADVTRLETLTAFDTPLQSPLRVVDFRALNEMGGDEPLEPADFYRLLELAQALEKTGFSQPVQLTVVSGHMQDVTGGESLRPEKAALLGPLKVIPQEYPAVRCRSIDLVPPPAGSREEETLLRLLLEELMIDPSPDAFETAVAFRNGSRWVEEFEPVEIGEDVKHSFPLRHKGVWLITGGLGNIGLALARRLAETIDARLVLTGRRGVLPEEERNALEQAGAEVLACPADVSDIQQMESVMQQAEARFGPVNGVIHAAGIVSDNAFMLISNINKQQCIEQFKAKIEGVRVLEQVLANRNPDICLLTSSLSSVLGGLGYAAYAAGNLFMDAFARKQRGRGKPSWISAGLDAWDVKEPGDFAEAVMRLLCRRRDPHIAVSISDLQPRLQRWVRLEEDDSRETGVESPPLETRQLSTPYVEPTTPMEKELARLWGEFFGLDRVGIHDNFFDLGASSLDLVQLSGKLKPITGRDIPVVTLFRFPMIGELAKHIGESPEQPGARPFTAKQEEKLAGEVERGRQSMQSRLQLIKGGSL